jgi:hypothetical protein
LKESNTLKIYLDLCCFNRPFDDQDQLLIWLDTISKLKIQQLILDGFFDLVWSFALTYENNCNPIIYRKTRISFWKEIAKQTIEYSEQVHLLAISIEQLHIHPKDASHLACALNASCDYFITT